MKRILLGLLAVCVAAPVIAATIGGGGGSGSGGGGAASAAGSTSAVQTNNAGQLADSGCYALTGSAKMHCVNGLTASFATLSQLTAGLGNSTGLPISSGVTGLGTGVATMLGTPSSANLKTALTDEVGLGYAVFSTGPRITLENATGVPATGLIGTTPLANGGTNQTSWTASRCVQVNAGGTALESASAACGTGSGGAASAVGASGAIQAANGSSNLADSGCYVLLSGEMTCPRGFIAGTSSLGVISMMQGTATVAGATTGQHNVWIDSTDGVLHSYGYGAASAATYVTTQTPATVWNKTVNAEATGNLITIVREYRFPMAGANGTTAGSVWNLPTTNPAVASAIQGTNVIQGVLNFPAAADTSAQVEHWISRFWDGGQVDAELTWMATPTTGTVVMNLQTVCIADGETNDPSFNATSANNTFTDAVKGTTLQTNLATVASLTMTGCAPGERLILKLRRASAPTDTMAGAPVSALNLKLWFREVLRKVAL